MKSRFKHFIALTVLLANGIASFGQQYPPCPSSWPQYPTLNYRDMTGDGKITEGDSLLCELEYREALQKYWSDMNLLGHYGKFTEEESLPAGPTQSIEITYEESTCDAITLSWSTTKIPQFYGILLKEENGDYIKAPKSYEWPHNKYSYVTPNAGSWHTIENLKPGTRYEIYIYGYILTNDSKGHRIIEELYNDMDGRISTKPITISSPQGKTWGNFGSVVVSFPDDCEVTKWEYDEKVLKKLGGNGSKVNGIITSSLSFDVLKYNTRTTIKATIKCNSCGKIYTREFPITIKDLNLYCESKVWRCNSVIKMNLENAPASLKTVKWTSSDNLQICYSGFNNTIKYAYFQAKGTGSAWIKASFTYNGITYTKQFSYSIIPKSASYMANKPITDVYTDSTDVLLLSVDELNMESQESSFIVYPNPATTELNIKQTVSSGNLSLEEDGAIKTVDIFDVKGNNCASHVFTDAQTTATLDITALATGIFILVINKDSDDAQTCSFVKK